MLGELCTPSLARLAHASPAEKDGLRPGSIARTGNLSPGSRTQASAQQGSPQSGDCSNWLNGNLTGLRAPLLGASLSATSRDRKSTRLNSSHDQISYAVFCLK